MKKLILILFAFTMISATKKNLSKDLEDCRIENIELNAIITKMVSNNDNVTIEYPCDKSRKDVKLAKIEGNVDIKLDKEIERLKEALLKCKSGSDLKLARVDRKKNNDQEKEKTKRNFVARFFGAIDKAIRGLTMGQLLGGFGGLSGVLMMIGEKVKPLGFILSFFKRKEDVVS